jgi:hypothetical protein
MTINRNSIKLTLIALHLMLFSMVYSQQVYDKIDNDELSTMDPALVPKETELLVAQIDNARGQLADREKYHRTEAGAKTADVVLYQAVMEQIMVAELADSIPGETTIGCFFIFKNRPRSFVYNVVKSEMKLIFEFNSAKIGSAPFPSIAQPPIKGFSVTQDTVNMNNRSTKQKPEWHVLTRVVFDLEVIPDIVITDDKSIISFTYKWTQGRSKQKTVFIQSLKKRGLLYASIGVGGAAAGGLLVYLTHQSRSEPAPADEPLGKLPTIDLPVYPSDFK